MRHHGYASVAIGQARRPDSGRSAQSRPALATDKYTAWPSTCWPWSGQLTVRGLLITARLPAYARLASARRDRRKGSRVDLRVGSPVYAGFRTSRARQPDGPCPPHHRRPGRRPTWFMCGGMRARPVRDDAGRVFQPGGASGISVLRVPRRCARSRTAGRRSPGSTCLRQRAPAPLVLAR